MAAVTLALNTTTSITLPSDGSRRRVVMPDVPGCRLRLVTPGKDVAVERVNASDESAAGAADETVTSGSTSVVYIGRGECALSCSGGATFDVVALEQDARGYVEDLTVETYPSASASPWFIPTLSGATQLDPNSILVSSSQDSDGWITAEVDASLGDYPWLDSGVSWEVELENLLGNAAEVGTQDLFWIFVEVASTADTLNAGAVVSNTDVTSAGGLGTMLESDGTGLKPHIARTTTAQASFGAYGPTVAAAAATVAVNTADGSTRGAAITGYTSAGLYVASTTSVASLTGFNALDRLFFGVGTVGGTGASSATVVFRPSIFVLSAAELIAALP